MSATVGVVAVAYGSEYIGFVRDWAERVAALQRGPNKVTIVSDQAPAELINDLFLMFGRGFTWIKSNYVPEHHPQILINEAITVTDTEWICKMDIDDLINPNALDFVDTCIADVYMFGIRYNGTDMYANNVTAQDILDSPSNVVFSGSPFRRSVWAKQPYRDMLNEDWAFWVEAAKNGAVFTPSKTIDYEYVMHGGNISLGINEPYWASVVDGLR